MRGRGDRVDLSLDYKKTHHPYLSMVQTINLILETRADRKISARSADFPDCVAVAETREEVIALMQKQLDDRLKSIELVSIFVKLTRRLEIG
jgi:hypothetical protein